MAQLDLLGKFHCTVYTVYTQLMTAG